MPFVELKDKETGGTRHINVAHIVEFEDIGKETTHLILTNQSDATISHSTSFVKAAINIAEGGPATNFDVMMNLKRS